MTVSGAEDKEEEDQEWLMVKRLPSYEDQEQLMMKRVPGQEDQDELCGYLYIIIYTKNSYRVSI